MSFMQRILVLCCMLPAFCFRFKQNTEILATTGMTPEVLCQDPKIISSACDTLAQVESNGASNGRMSEEQLRNYFVAEPSDIRAFWDAIGLHGESTLCHKLCTRTLEYVKERLGWPLPHFTNRQCTLWEYKQVGNSKEFMCKTSVLVSVEAMEMIAKQNDIPDEVQEERDPEAKDVENVDMPDAIIKRASAYLAYSVTELVERISNLFRVFPSEPRIVGSSFLELDPVFHTNVNKSQRQIWTQITTESRAWTDSVLQKFPHAMVRAFFGAETDAEIQEVRRVLAGMIKTLDRMKIKNGPTEKCADGTKAFVVVARDEQQRFIHSEIDNGRYVVNFCPRYWKPEVWSEPSAKFGMLVHESAHHHGPTDMKFRGSIAYGVAQCLRIARMSTAGAINNADNFMQFVYYVNRCWNEPRSSVSSEAPCVASIGPVKGKVLLSPKCSRDVEVATVKFEDDSGNTLKAHSNIGQWKASQSGSIIVPVIVGMVVKFFYEVDCMIFEGQVVYQGVAVNIQTKMVLDLSSGAGGGKAQQERHAVGQDVTVQSSNGTYTPHPLCHTECGASHVTTTSPRVTLEFPRLDPNTCLHCEMSASASPPCRSDSLVFFTTIRDQDLCCANLLCTSQIRVAPQYVLGQIVGYFSQSTRTWFATRVTQVGADGVEIDLKPGQPIPNLEVPAKLKLPQAATQVVDPCSNCPNDTTGCFATRFVDIIKTSCMDSKYYEIDGATCTKQWHGKWCDLPRHS